MIDEKDVALYEQINRSFRTKYPSYNTYLIGCYSHPSKSFCFCNGILHEKHLKSDDGLTKVFQCDEKQVTEIRG